MCNFFLGRHELISFHTFFGDRCLNEENKFKTICELKKFKNKKKCRFLQKINFFNCQIGREHQQKKYAALTVAVESEFFIIFA